MDLNETVTPTIDVRIDYLAPATGERLVAEAEVTRNVRKSLRDFRSQPEISDFW
ncbi:hotdog domain-containing protein [Halomarina litorea]|uniref:hotdog domain-containing protein n=1 Tax=Halomarina litorea TaxID=2961595 RepID=UPI0020C37008|nr:hotdog domain-containing protein [Halomarina sp. BCD28]